MTTPQWNAKIYSEFLDARTRPAKDLLSSIPNAFHPNLIYDLGCGPGNSTILLKNRWSHAKVIGIDTSPDMLLQAKSDYPTLEFIESDIEQFNPSEKADCLFANASLQWCDHHEILIPNLTQHLNKNGILAIQMPNNFHQATHQTIIEVLQHHEPWQSIIKNLRFGVLDTKFYKLPWYYDVLLQSGLSDIQLWETEYYVEMNHYSDIFDWGKGTGLRPVLSAMNDEDKKQFEKEFIDIISTKYPTQKNGKILLPFNRIFMTGVYF